MCERLIVRFEDYAHLQSIRQRLLATETEKERQQIASELQSETERIDKLASSRPQEPWGKMKARMQKQEISRPEQRRNNHVNSH